MLAAKKYKLLDKPKYLNGNFDPLVVLDKMSEDHQSL